MSERYCQHTHRLRFNRPPGLPDLVSERPRQEDPPQRFLDGPAGTQVTIPDDAVGLNIASLLAIGAVAALPCAEHPGSVSRETPGAGASSG